MRQNFGFNEEILLLVSDYHNMQSRTLQAVEAVYNQAPFSGRADPLTYFLVSLDKQVEDWTSEYLAQHPQARTPIALNWYDVTASKHDSWYIRNKLSTKLYSRDIFDYQLPLDGDLFFFGRTKLVEEFLDAIRKSQNRGLFGLRKTGKTSFLFKLVRACTDNKLAHAVYIDCKRPDIRTRDWKSLLEYTTEQIWKQLKVKRSPSGKPVDDLIDTLSKLGPNERVCLIFDEIEYLSPLTHADSQWSSDFVPFWQTLWSVQSEFRRISFVVAGVNPHLCEVDLIDRIQNPMFGIVRPSYLTGLQEDEVRQMAQVIGRRMGLAFADEAITYLHTRYGGHPLLTRMACSFTNQSLELKNQARPVLIKADRLQKEQAEREEELHFYCRHVVSELREFYNEEYDLLEILSSGNVVDFIELSAEPGWIKHLKSYGIISVASNGRPTFKIPVIQRFVAGERARRLRTGELRSIVQSSYRTEWLVRRKANILHDLKMLLRIIDDKGLWQPYGQPFIPEADLLQTVSVATNWADFTSFVTDLNKCLIETIEVIHGNKNAFYRELRANYPELFDALSRIRLLRNNADHLRLNKRVEESLAGYFARDLYDKPITQIAEPWFLLQQICLDELFAAIQYETNKLS
jgi:hypothetical protein